MSEVETSSETTVEIQPEVDPIQTIYEGQCESLSGRSTLSFTVGRHPETHALHLRIVRNSGGGMFCDEWIDADHIEAIVSGATELTSRSFQVLQPGRSINTAGFVAAVLKALGYIRTNAENSRLHEHVPTETFEKVVMARIAQVGEPSTTKTVAKTEAKTSGKTGRRKAKGA